MSSYFMRPDDYDAVYYDLIVKIRVIQCFALLTEAVSICDGFNHISMSDFAITLFVALGSFAVCAKRLINLLRDNVQDNENDHQIPVEVPCINPYLVAAFGGSLSLVSHLISSPIGLVGLNKFLYDWACYTYIAATGAIVSIDVFDGLRNKKTHVA